MGFMLVAGFVKDSPTSTKCVGCSEGLKQGDLAVIAPKFRDHMMWHPRCFCCTACQELLVDLTYCVFEDKLYCERHYAEMLKPRCNACDEVSSLRFPSLIFVEENSHSFWRQTHSLSGDTFCAELSSKYLAKPLWINSKSGFL